MTGFAVTSRYQVDSNGISASPKDKQIVLYSQYRASQGDSMSNIAARLLGDDRRWWEIADINPQIKYPEDLAPGDIIRIPR